MSFKARGRRGLAALLAFFSVLPAGYAATPGAAGVTSDVPSPSESKGMAVQSLGQGFLRIVAPEGAAGADKKANLLSQTKKIEAATDGLLSDAANEKANLLSAEKGKQKLLSEENRLEAATDDLSSDAANEKANLLSEEEKKQKGVAGDFFGADAEDQEGDAEDPYSHYKSKLQSAFEAAEDGPKKSLEATIGIQSKAHAFQKVAQDYADALRNRAQGFYSDIKKSGIKFGIANRAWNQIHKTTFDKLGNFLQTNAEKLNKERMLPMKFPAAFELPAKMNIVTEPEFSYPELDDAPHRDMEAKYEDSFKDAYRKEQGLSEEADIISGKDELEDFAAMLHRPSDSK